MAYSIMMAWCSLLQHSTLAACCFLLDSWSPLGSRREAGPASHSGTVALSWRSPHQASMALQGLPCQCKWAASPTGKWHPLIGPGRQQSGAFPVRRALLGTKVRLTVRIPTSAPSL